jgi:hypothetical protein
MNKIILTVSLIILVQSIVLHAGEPFSARVQGMGGAGVVIPSDAATIYWNPAGLMYQNGIAMDATLQFDDLDWPANWGFSYLNYNRYAARGAGLGIYRLKSEQQGSSPDGNVVATHLATVYRTPLGVPVGLTIKYLNESREQEKRKHFVTFDAGFLIPLGPWLAGVNFQSLTGPDSRLLPYRVMGGLAWTYHDQIMLVSQAIVHNWEQAKDWSNEADLRFGLELAFSRSFALQGGWAQRPGEKYWTGGLGLYSADRRSRINLAYHWHPSGKIDDRVFVSLGYYL